MSYRFTTPEEVRCQAELPEAKHLPPLEGRWCPNRRVEGEDLCEWHIAKRDRQPEPIQGGLF